MLKLEAGTSLVRGFARLLYGGGFPGLRSGLRYVKRLSEVVETPIGDAIRVFSAEIPRRSCRGYRESTDAESIRRILSEVQFPLRGVYPMTEVNPQSSNLLRQGKSVELRDRKGSSIMQWLNFLLIKGLTCCFYLPVR
ncbi:MAG: hypothetical protein QI197_00730 [Candidatus Korarchaeota archaeon]|nr:hypothetical protein [Candidatus Korarchaeota archaeon]